MNVEQCEAKWHNTRCHKSKGHEGNHKGLDHIWAPGVIPRYQCCKPYDDSEGKQHICECAPGHLGPCSPLVLDSRKTLAEQQDQSYVTPPEEALQAFVDKEIDRLAVQCFENSAGIKHDQQKTRYDLMPWLALDAVADVMSYGANKYGDRNWEAGLSFSRCFSALCRHLFAWFLGEEKDVESGHSHLAHVACNALFLLHYSITKTGTDDRPKGV